MVQAQSEVEEKCKWSLNWDWRDFTEWMDWMAQLMRRISGFME